MAEEYITRDELRANLAEMRGDWAEFRADIMMEFSTLRKDMADMRADLAFRLPLWAFIGGLAGGLIAAAAKIFG